MMNKVVYYSGKVRNGYMILQQIYSGNYYQVSSESPEFYRRYYNKYLVSFFWHSDISNI